jgi:hypothetical protein
VLFEPSGSPFIIRNRLGVLTAIEFDDQLTVYAGEIDDKRTNRNLAAELQSGQSAAAELEPENALDGGLVSTELTSAVRFGAVSHFGSALF